MNEKAMSRAELDKWAREKQGWIRFVQKYENLQLWAMVIKTPDGSVLAPMVWCDTREEAEAFVSAREPNPTREIGAAFGLKEWFLDPCRVPKNDEVAALRCIAGGQKFMEAWNSADLWCESAEFVATWICQHVYEAVEGVRVVLKD